MAAHERKKEEKSRTKWLLLFLLLLLLIASISITIWALFFRRVPTLAPDYAPRQEEPYAEDMGDDSLSLIHISALRLSASRHL